MLAQKAIDFLREFCRAQYAQNNPGYEEAREAFLQTGDNNGINWIGHVGDMAATLYALEKRPEDLALARECVWRLCETQDELARRGARFQKSGNLFVEALKQSGVAADPEKTPILEQCFTFAPLLKGLYRLRQADALREDEWARIERLARPHVATAFHEMEWGAHNRCALRAVLLALYAKLFPQSDLADACARYADRMMRRSLGGWSIEDACGYQLIWLNCVCEYAELTGDNDLRLDVATHHYAAFYAGVMTPDGGLPEFGDAQYDSGNFAMLAAAVVARCARRFRGEALQWAAARMLSHVTETRNVTNGSQAERGLVNLACWADDTLAEAPIPPKSGEALEDLVSKKVVFRDADETRGLYLFYNYRDVGPYGRLARGYLQNSIPVHAEKPHHGHADEQAINALCAYGATLLRDGGYRDGFTMDAHYRADFYHNRVVVRNGRTLSKDGLIAYALDLGDYEPVRSEKLFFERFAFADALRTFAVDEARQARVDRGVVFLRDAGCFVVLDTVTSLREQALTCGPLFFSERVEKERDGLYWFDACAGENLSMFWDDKSRAKDHAAKLLVAFGERGFPCATEALRRNYQTEYGLSRYASRFFRANETAVFVTLLMPVESEAARAGALACADSLAVEAGDCGFTVRLKDGGAQYWIGWRHEPGCGVHDRNHRPAYDFAHGAVRHGPYESDATLLLTAEQAGRGRFGFVEATRVDREGKTLFTSRPYANLQLDYTREQGVWSWGSHEDEYTV